VFVALVSQRAMCMRHIVICNPSSCTVFFYVILQTARLKKKITEHNMGVLIFSTICA